MKRLVVLSFAFLFMTTLSFGQTSLFAPEASIEVSIDPTYGHLYEHELKAQQTIYSLSQFFECQVNDIYQLNLKDKDYIFQINENVKIPFHPFSLITNPEEIAQLDQKIAVYYKVKAKENLYRISRTLFPQSMDHIMSNNQMQDFNLSLNQRLLVGYMSLEPNWTPITSNPTQIVSIAAISQLDRTLFHQRAELEKMTASNNEDDLSDYSLGEEEARAEAELSTELNTEEDVVEIVEAKAKRKLFQNSGVALSDHKISDKENLFVLHKTAKVNTLIEIYYPLSSRTVTAQVVGNIPASLYRKDIDVIISPKVAQTLGVRDARSRVKMKYYQ